METGPLLAEIIAHETIIAVSNGLYKDQQGTATWVFYTALDMTRAISHGMNDTGHTQGSYCSKLVGIYGIVATISMLCQFYQIQQGMVQVICNGESTLKCCFQHWISNPLEKHFDLIHAICTNMWTTTLEWQWEHIFRHQDATSLATSDKACWNNVMDTAAKNTGTTSRITLTLPCWNLGEPW